MRNRFGVPDGPGALLAVLASLLAAGGVRAATVQFVDSGGELAGQQIRIAETMLGRWAMPWSSIMGNIA